MKLGIIFAMKEELNALKKFLKIEREFKIYDLVFFEAKYNNNTCILVESGIGKVNAARCAQVLIDKVNVDYIFNIGVAGGIDKSLNVCDVVIATSLVQHDFDITAFEHDKGYIPNVGININTDKYLLNITKEIDDSLKYGVIASGDIFCTDINMSSKINNKFNALCVEMEGASIAQVCYLCSIPFLIIRCISDVPNNNNNITFDEFLEISSNKVADIMMKLMNKLKK